MVWLTFSVNDLNEFVQTGTNSPTPSVATTPSPTPDVEEHSFSFIKKDINHYTNFKEERFYVSWEEGLRATCRRHDCLNVLDPNYVSATQQAQDLFQKKQVSMYLVFQHVLQTSQGKLYVHEEKNTGDAQAVFHKLDAFYTQGATDKHSITDLSNRIAGLKLNDQ